jgi:hypothetical protein
MHGKGSASMSDDNQYDKDAYKRLELVQKQFQKNQSEEKKKRSAERRRRLLTSLGKNKVVILRFTVYAVLAALVIAVIVILIRQ